MAATNCSSDFATVTYGTEDSSDTGTGINTYQFTAIVEVIGSLTKAVKQTSICLKYFWRGCKLFLQATAHYTDGTSKVLFEEWHYGKQKLRLVLGRVFSRNRSYLVVLRLSLKRGRHWDRKRKNG